MNYRVSRAWEVQAFAEQQLNPEVSLSSDLEQWNLAQSLLSAAIRELESMVARTPEEEGELVLAILMAYGVTVRNGRELSAALERAMRVIPLLENPVLKCKLAAYCYLEIPDEELLEMVRSLVEELKEAGRGGEVLQIKQMILD